LKAEASRQTMPSRLQTNPDPSLTVKMYQSASDTPSC
jgi:hypothetical protein